MLMARCSVKGYLILLVLNLERLMSILKVSKMISTRHVKAARALLAWSQADLAEASGVSEPTIKRLEAFDGPIGGRENTAEKIRSALEREGIEFLDDGEPGVRLRLRRWRKPEDDPFVRNAHLLANNSPRKRKPKIPK
jgi:transcriptional regulator with XRE-family HTH domain